MSLEFEVFKHTDHSLRSDASYVGTYVFRQHGKDVYSLPLRSKHQFPQECQLLDMSGHGVLDMSIRKEGSLIKKPVLYFVKSGDVLGKYQSKAFVNPRGDVIWKAVDPSSLSKQILRTMAEGDTPHYGFLAADQKTVMATMTRESISASLPWPLSIAEKIAKAAASSGDQKVYSLVFNDAEVAPEPILAASALLAEYKESSNPAL